MGNIQTIIDDKKIGFEDVQTAITTHNYLIINTLPIETQDCLISKTIVPNYEVELLNRCIQEGKTHSCQIIVYGKNSTDNTVDKKYQQLKSLGFKNVYVYSGGLFEWLLLQDIYGIDNFPTTKREKDILKFKPPKKIGGFYLTS
jgi:hypothetical protein